MLKLFFSCLSHTGGSQGSSHPCVNRSRAAVGGPFPAAFGNLLRPVTLAKSRRTAVHAVSWLHAAQLAAGPMGCVRWVRGLFLALGCERPCEDPWGGVSPAVLGMELKSHRSVHGECTCHFLRNRQAVFPRAAHVPCLPARHRCSSASILASPQHRQALDLPPFGVWAAGGTSGFICISCISEVECTGIHLSRSCSRCWILKLLRHSKNASLCC